MDKEQQEKSGWSFRKESDPSVPDQESEPPPSTLEPISWTASEYVSHQKDIVWYLVLAAATLAVCGLTYWLSDGDLISVGSIAVVAALFGFLAGKKPREFQYTVNSKGIVMGGKLYSYSQFISFSIHHEGVLTSVNLWPLQRFMPDLSIYCPPDQEQNIIEFLSEHLPNEQRIEHPVDRLMKRIRF